MKSIFKHYGLYGAPFHCFRTKCASFTRLRFINPAALAFTRDTEPSGYTLDMHKMRTASSKCLPLFLPTRNFVYSTLPYCLRRAIRRLSMALTCLRSFMHTLRDRIPHTELTAKSCTDTASSVKARRILAEIGPYLPAIFY